MLRILGGRRASTQHGFRMPDRSTSRDSYATQFHQLGLQPPNQTDYRWSSKNGGFYMVGDHRIFPKLDGRPAYFCKMPLSTCFGSDEFFDMMEEDYVSTTWLFKNVAYANPRCGDCITAGLVTASGKQGLEAALPPHGHLEERFPQTNQDDGKGRAPFLGDLSVDWKEMDVSLDAVLRDEWTPRDFAVRLIQRYSYVIGET